MGFVLNKNNGSFLKRLSASERLALHERIAWARQPGNNPIFQAWGATLENFDTACQQLMSHFTSTLPEGCVKARIKAFPRENAQDGTLGETLGDESVGMVMIDMQGHPIKCPGRALYSVARAHCSAT